MQQRWSGLRKTSISFATVIGAICLLPAGAMALDYTLDSALRYDASHDDNLQMSAQPQSAFGQTASAKIKTAVASEQTTADIDAQLWARRYNRSGFDSDDQTVLADVAHNFERSSLGLGLSLVRDSTLTSELLDSGRIRDAQRHEQYSASPKGSYQLDEKNLVSLSGSYMESRYAGSGYTDYTYWQTQLLWTHNLNERLRGFAAVNYSDYQSDPQRYPFEQSYATASMDRGLQLGGDYQLSQTVVASVLAGVSRNHTDVQIGDPQHFCPFAQDFGLLPLFPLCALRDTDSSLTTINGTLSWNGQRDELTLDVSRNTQPSSNGYVQEVEQLNLNWRHHIWEYGTLGLLLTAGTTDTPSAQSARSSSLSRDYEYATLSYTHSLTESWLIDCNVQYRSQQYKNAERVESNVAFVGITWKPQTQHWSR